jgi:predicted AlkP superfamily pyrophosphatase or phosphodiesterase
VTHRLASSFAGLLACALVSGAASCGVPGKVAKVAELVAHGKSRELRERPDDAPQSSPGRPPILLVAFDGVGRDLLYDLLRKGKLPALAALLGESGGKFPHAYFDDRFLSTLPSSTMAAWATAMTGLTPSQHGITGNEFFVREERKLGAPAPVSFVDSKPTLAIYTDGYLDGLKKGPSVYDRIREKDPNVLAWVAMHQVYSGADRLLVTKPTIIAHAFEHAIIDTVKKVEGAKKPTRDAYQKLDEQVISGVIDELDDGALPDVLTVYLSGTDLYAHIAEEGPDEARRTYLVEVADPAIAKLTARLRERGALDGRYVLVTADHGHTQVLYDEAHSLDTKNDDDPPAVMKKAGYRVRPFAMDVDEKSDFDAVYVAGGAMAYLYVADRSTCATAGAVCDWKKPPRYEEDVVPLAQAFFDNDAKGSTVPAMKGTLDAILTRKPKPFAEVDLPFEVYVGGGKTISVDEWLKQHPHPTYVAVAARLRDLAVGPLGERAGDILLLAHNGDRDKPEERYYFASLYRSWHGSPSKSDSEIPLIVAHPKKTTDSLRAVVTPILGDEPYQQKLTDLMLALRFGE